MTKDTTPMTDAQIDDELSSTLEVFAPAGLQKVASKEHSRYALSGAAYVVTESAKPADDDAPAGTVDTPGSGYWAATDGRGLVVVPAAHTGHLEPGRTSALVPLSVLPGRKSGDTLKLNGRAEAVTSGKISDYLDGNFPPIVDVIPKWEPAGDDTVATVTLNARLLNQIALAVTNQVDGCEPSVTLRISTKSDMESSSRPIIVVGATGIGVLMPVQTDLKDSERRYNTTRSMVR